MKNTYSEQGYKVFDSNSSIDKLIEELIDFGYGVMRDIVIGLKNDNCDLIANPTDFHFHSDGVFLTLPPKWVIIKVLKCDIGGRLRLFDTNPILNDTPEIDVFFGINNVGVVEKIKTKHNNHNIFRYREDYMAVYNTKEQIKFQNFKNFLKNKFIEDSIDIGELQVENFILIDNWRYLHFREKFSGNRKIRRIWL